MTPRRLSYHDTIYGYQIIGVYGGKFQSAIDSFAKGLGVPTWEVKKEPDANFSAYAPERNGLLWFREAYPSVGIVAHECFHATMYLFELLHMKGPVEDTEEVFAYYLQNLVTAFYRTPRK